MIKLVNRDHVPASVNAPVDSRCDNRLHPARSSRRYWVLDCLRREIEKTVAVFFDQSRDWTVIDFGCGSMPYRQLMEPLVSSYIGCDLPGNHLADCTLTTPTLPFGQSTIDVVFSSQVLEHVADPSAYLCECRRVLRDNGVLIVSTHGVWKYHPHPDDYWRWTSQGLQRQIENAGFTIERFRGILGPAATGLQIYQDARLRKNALRWYSAIFTWYMQRRIRWADLRCGEDERNLDASVYCVVARKKAPVDV